MAHHTDMMPNYNQYESTAQMQDDLDSEGLWKETGFGTSCCGKSAVSGPVLTLLLLLLVGNI